MKQANTPILMATIGGPHGIKGEVRVKSFTQDPLALGNYGGLSDSDGKRFRIVRMRPAKSVLIVKFKGVNTRIEAEALNGVDLYVPRDQLPEPDDDDEFYVSDLIGAQAVDDAGTILGTVVDIPDFGAGPLLELQLTSDGGQTRYLAFTNENVPDIDLEQNTVLIRLPDEVSERDET